MKAIQVTQTGGPEVLTLADLPAPTPKANEALIEIKAIREIGALRIAESKA